MCITQVLMFLHRLLIWCHTSLMHIHILTYLLLALNSLRLLTMRPQLGIHINQDMNHMIHCRLPTTIPKHLLPVIPMCKPNTLCHNMSHTLSIPLIHISLLIGMIHIDLML
jgi:hypothetical protein